MTAAVFGTVLVVVAVLVIVLVSVTGGGKPAAGSGFGMKAAPTSVVSAVTGVSPSAFTIAGSSVTSSGPWTQFLSVPKKPKPLTEDGKPLIVYVGSNYCPFCAATRWPLAVALARFGTFKNLKITSSGLGDEYPGTNTLSFYHTSYTSPYIAFLASEQCTDVEATVQTAATEACFGYEPLQSMSATAGKVFAKYDGTPYQTSTNAGGIPFIDFGNHLIEDGAFMDPTILGGYTHAQIAASLSNPSAAPGQTILDAANYYSAEICKLTGGKPGSICNMPVVKQAGAALAKL
jgi:hypothetical protein